MEFQNICRTGDSGSLVFRHSLSSEKDSLNVVAMVEAETTIPNVGDRIICFPMKKGCETLIKKYTRFAKSTILRQVTFELFCRFE